MALKHFPFNMFFYVQTGKISDQSILGPVQKTVFLEWYLNYYYLLLLDPVHFEIFISCQAGLDRINLSALKESLAPVLGCMFMCFHLWQTTNDGMYNFDHLNWARPTMKWHQLEEVKFYHLKGQNSTRQLLTIKKVTHSVIVEFHSLVVWVRCRKMICCHHMT